MRNPPKIKSRRGRPPLIQKRDSLKGLRKERETSPNCLEGRRQSSQCFVDILYKKGALTFNDLQAVQEFLRLYKAYLSILKVPRYARVSFETDVRMGICESRVDEILCLWRRSQSVLKPYGLQGEKLLKKICEESFLEASSLTQKEFCTLKEMTHVLFKLYTLNKYHTHLS